MDDKSVVKSTNQDWHTFFFFKKFIIIDDYGAD